MGAYSGPEINESGLILCLDAGNTKSYPGSGTTWTDISRNGNDGSFVNMDGANLDSANGGSLTFDGTNEYVTLSSTQIAPGTGAFTWNFWVKHISTSASYPGYFSILLSGTGSNSNYGVIALDTQTYGLGYYANGYKIFDSDTDINDKWLNVVFVGNGGVDGSRNLKLYKNGVQIGNTFTTNYDFTSPTPNIGANHSAYAELMRGNISNVSYYNRALSASEIKQNFNALRGRFGL